MKHLKLVAILGFLLFQNSTPQEVENRHLTVYGKVKVFAKADRAKVFFSIKGTGRHLEAAFRDAKSKMQNIADRLESLGLDRDNISTSFFQSHENYGITPLFSTRKDYEAYMTVSVRTDSLPLLEPIVIAISEGDIEKIHNISFELIHYSALRKEGLLKATVKAREKAKLVSQKLGIALGEIINFEEVKNLQAESESRAVALYGGVRYGGVRSPFNESYFMGDTVGGDHSGLYSQEITFYSEVKIVYKIMKQNE